MAAVTAVTTVTDTDMSTRGTLHRIAYKLARIERRSDLVECEDCQGFGYVKVCTCRIEGEHSERCPENKMCFGCLGLRVRPREGGAREA